MRLFARGGQSQSKSQGALLGGRTESVRATITSWGATFEIYYFPLSPKTQQRMSFAEVDQKSTFAEKP